MPHDYKHQEKFIELILSKEEGNINIAATQIRNWGEPIVIKIVRIGGGKNEEIQTILNDAVLELIQLVHKGSYNPSIASLRTLFYSIAKNKWLDELKRRYHNNIHETSLDESTRLIDKMHLNPIEEHIFTLEEKEKIRKSLQQLDPACKELFEMKYLSGISLRTIAGKLNITEDAVKKRHERCKKKLKKILGKDPRTG